MSGFRCGWAALSVIAVAAVGCGASSPGARHEVDRLAQADVRPATASANPDPAEHAPREIIYSAEVSLVAADFDHCESQLPLLVAQHGGFIAQANVDRTSGSSRTGRWTLRVPAGRYQALVDALPDLGYAETCRQTTADVTAESMDVDARLANARKLESSIARLLETRSGDIKDVIAVEQELGRVRGDIERTEARRRWLRDQTALSTITLSVREQQAFTPPEAPTLVNRLADAWNHSTADVIRMAQAALVVVAAVTPWILAVLPLVALAVLQRRLRLWGAVKPQLDVRS